MNYDLKYGVLFDCDGTVLDTEPLYAQFWEEQGRIFHPEIENFGDLILGKSLEKILELYFSDSEKKRELVKKRLDDYENEIKFQYLPGAKELLQNLKDKGIPCALVTSSNNDKLAKIERSRPEFKGFFKNIITSNKVSNPKPDPEPYIKGAKSLKLDPKRCIVFEDSFSGIKAGKAAGCFVIGLATSKPEEEIREMTSDVIENLSKISFDYIERNIVPKLPN